MVGRRGRLATHQKYFFEFSFEISILLIFVNLGPHSLLLHRYGLILLGQVGIISIEGQIQ